MTVIGDLDEVTYDLEVDGEDVRRTLHRRIWQRGGWATVAIAYQERAAGGDWKPAKLALIRFQRVRDAWKRHAAITLRGGDAVALGQTLAAWHDALAGESGEPDDPADAEP
jgi:predicted trehalose synthase